MSPSIPNCCCCLAANLFNLVMFNFTALITIANSTSITVTTVTTVATTIVATTSDFVPHCYYY